MSDRIDGQSFLCYELDLPSFDLFWHYHPEYELTYILSGKGKRLVGSSCEAFSSGDLVLLGPELPHAWVSEKKAKQNCRAVVIQFSKKFIEPFLQYPELNSLQKLLTDAAKGIRFTGNQKEVERLICEIISLPKPDKLIRLMHVLQRLTEIKTRQLTPVAFMPIKKNADQQRINRVFQYVQNGYKQTVSLTKAASLIHLSESSFCKYFKRVSGKTFSDYVNEIRVAHACQLLIESDRAVSQVAYESGFTSLTYFNRVFLKKKRITPKEFRRLE
ncbi:MAG: AraC family transcriptional regulator [Bacteroidetes bacterium]|nr:AraC family transcriptional regulator [Bacteroidota bacterium]